MTIRLHKRQETQRMLDRQKLADDLQKMEGEMELDRLKQQTEQALAMAWAWRPCNNG